MGLDGATAAAAAVTDGIKAIQHGVFEECMMHMAACMLSLQDIHALLGRDPPGTERVVFDYKAGKRLTDNETDVKG
jgi:hypothetical protein